MMSIGISLFREEKSRSYCIIINTLPLKGEKAIPPFFKFSFRDWIFSPIIDE